MKTTDDSRPWQVRPTSFFPRFVAQTSDGRGEVKPLLTAKKTIVSIVAGKTLAKLRAAFGTKVRLIRVMPNLALRAKAGMCAICPGPKAPAKDVKAVEAILGGAGATVVLKEKDFDAVTALSGRAQPTSPTWRRRWPKGGVALGLKPAVARLLAEQTMYGTAKFLRESGMELKRSSTASARKAHDGRGHDEARCPGLQEDRREDAGGGREEVRRTGLIFTYQQTPQQGRRVDDHSPVHDLTDKKER